MKTFLDIKMPETITTSKIKTKKDIRRKVTINWDKLSYKDMVNKVEELAGPKPGLPKNLPENVLSSPAFQVLKEKYFLKNDKREGIEKGSEICWRVAWE